MDHIVASRGVQWYTFYYTHTLLYLFCVIYTLRYRRCHCCSQILILRTDCPLVYLAVLVKIKTNKQTTNPRILFRLLYMVTCSSVVKFA